ncbi:MAG: hypothetical protein OEV08_10100 [Nitrospira sp.]|nr:hypothetical protein [Nitrospira sp.]
MMTFKVKHGEVQFQVIFTEPMFELLDPPSSRFHNTFLNGLSEFGVGLNDIKLAQGVPNLSEACVTFHLLDHNAMIRVQLDKAELTFLETTQLTQERIEKIYRKTFECLKKVANNLRIKEYILNIALHGSLERATLDEFWKGFLVKSPAGLGPAAGNGLVFYYGAGGNTKASSIVADMSARISNGLFVRSSVTLDGSSVSFDALPNAAKEAFSTQIHNLGLILS